jgi:hypothetical protein
MDPTVIVVVMSTYPDPVSLPLYHRCGLAQHELVALFGADRWLSREWSDGAQDYDRRHDSKPPQLLCGGGALLWQSLQRVTPRKLQIRQMKVPHFAQG